MVSQCLDTHGNVIRAKKNKKNKISLILEMNRYLFLNFLVISIINGKKNKIMPVGFVIKIRAKEIPDRDEKRLTFFVSKNHFDKKNKFNVLKEVSDKSIK